MTFSYMNEYYIMLYILFSNKDLNNNKTTTRYSSIKKVDLKHSRFWLCYLTRCVLSNQCSNVCGLFIYITEFILSIL